MLRSTIMKHHPIWFAVFFLVFGLISSSTPAQDTPAPPEPVTTAEASPATKTTIAILAFQTQPKIDTRAAAAVSTRLIEALEQMEEFSVMSNDGVRSAADTLEFTRKGKLKVDSAVKWGVANGADYVLFGSVVAAGKGHGGMGIGGVRISTKAISFAVEILLIHASSGEAIIEDTFKEETMGLGLALGTIDFDPESRRGSEMVGIVLNQIVRAIVTGIHPPTVTAVDDAAQVVTLDAGSSLFGVGQRWELFTASLDEDGAPKGRKVDKTGTIEITTVGETSATATITDGTAAVGVFARFDREAKE